MSTAPAENRRNYSFMMVSLPFRQYISRSRSSYKFAIEGGKMANQFICLRANMGEAYWVMGDRFTYLVTGAESGESYFSLIADIRPFGGPPPHVHHLEEEQFYVLEGELAFSVGEQTFQVKGGDFVHIPRETVHSFKNGPTMSRLLVTFSPAGIEGFFREVGEPVIDQSTSSPLVTEETIARLFAAEAAGWKDHHDILPQA
jgi:quercetin dioxygenase-like cupin family protein